MLRLIFPPKCIFCRKLLKKDEWDLCHSCRNNAPEWKRAKRNIPFIAQWTALWYYKDDVRKSIHRFKFYGARNYTGAYARMLALKLQQSLDKEYDVLTWVPVSWFRKLKRGYDQTQLLTRALGNELGCKAAPILKKIRHTPPQSGFRDAAQRRANVMGAYRVIDRERIAGKRVLLVDDVITTGATASECARTLLTAGAEKVYFAAIAAADHDKK